MFTDAELDGCTSPWMEDWVNAHEDAIREVAKVFDSHVHWQDSRLDPYYYDSQKLEQVMALLFALHRDT